MSGSSMSQNDLELFREFLTKKKSRTDCPQCRNTGWIGAGPYFIPIFKENNIKLGDGMPVVAKVCSNCGYIEWYSWLIISNFRDTNG
jgi:predicted nucleic-acid-binding Zn-ribbon protein